MTHITKSKVKHSITKKNIGKAKEYITMKKNDNKCVVFEEKRQGKCENVTNGIYGENFVKPFPELEEGKEVYDVETILNHRKRG